jgi:hypothetical protein
MISKLGEGDLFPFCFWCVFLAVDPEEEFYLKTGRRKAVSLHLILQIHFVY